MIKKIIVLIAALGLITGTVSCTSTSSDSDATAESDDIASLDAGSEGGDDLLMGTEASEEELGSDETALTDDSGSADLSASTEESLPTDETASTDEASLETVTEVLPGDDSFSASNAESAQILGEVPAPTEPEVAANEQTNWDSMSSGNEVALSATTTKTEYSTGSADTTTVETPKIGLQKMATTPWKQGKTNYNTLYFARPGDSIASISKMIYGSDRTAELLKGNPTYQTRDIRPGDKVYYESPNRPTDDSKIITYYEDIGLAPEMYVAQNDEKLRDVAITVLGYKDGWKELWSINDIESKSTVSSGTQLRFWKGAPAVSATMASNTMPAMNEAPQMPEVAPSMPPVEATPPPPMPQDPMAMAGSEMPSTEDLDAQLGSINNPEVAANMDMPPPPPPPTEMAPPPPPPMAAAPPPAVEESFEEEVPAMDSEMMMALGVIGAAAALLAGLMVIRKKKQREMEQALNETQVG